MVLWLDDRATPSAIRMSLRRAGSSVWTTSAVIHDAAARPQSVALAVRPDGRAVASWQDARGASLDIYQAEYSPATESFGPATLVSDDPAAAASPSLRATIHHEPGRTEGQAARASSDREMGAACSDPIMEGTAATVPL